MPIPIRWICKYCGYEPDETSFGSSAFLYGAEDCLYDVNIHEAKCPYNSESRSCPTCRHKEITHTDEYGIFYKCLKQDGLPNCYNFKLTGKYDKDFPIGCREWEVKEDAKDN